MSVRTVSTSPTNDRRTRRPGGRGGFTLVEVMIVTVISSFVFAGVLSAYIFLGRALTRQGNAESMESRSRIALFYFTRDVSASSAVTTYTPSMLALVTPTATVTYTYTAPTTSQSNDGFLTRSQTPANPSIPATLLINLSSFAFQYLSISGSAPSSATTVKQIQFVYTAKAGGSVTGAQSQITVASPRVIMKNKPSLQ
jgi:prepilin-type N-terminal cleavage/methylation domain-containing protein